MEIQVINPNPQCSPITQENNEDGEMDSVFQAARVSGTSDDQLPAVDWALRAQDYKFRCCDTLAVFEMQVSTGEMQQTPE